MAETVSLIYLSPELTHLTSGTAFDSILRQIQDESADVSAFAPEYDYPGVPFNRIRTFLKIVQRYFCEVHSFFILENKFNSKSKRLVEKIINENDINKSDCNNNSDSNNNVDCNNNGKNKIINDTGHFEHHHFYSDVKKTYAIQLEQHLKRHLNVAPSKLDQIFQDLQAMGRFFLTFFQMIRLRHESNLLSEDASSNEFDHPCQRKLNDFIIEAVTFENLSCFYNEEIGLFWFPPFKRKLWLSLHSLNVLRWQPWSVAFRSLFDQQVRKKAIYNSVYNIKPEHVTWTMGIFDWKILKLAYSTYFLTRPARINSIEVTRQNVYRFTPSGELVESFVPTIENQCETVNCRFVDATNDTLGKNTDLVIHAHGSGFIGMNPETHTTYIENWSKKIGKPFLIPNYSKAPLRPFPHAMQDMLDVYLFLRDEANAAQVKKLLGFVPKKILFFGDSAGGNLVLCLTNALNDLNRHRKAKDQLAFEMPVAIALLYPACAPVVSYSFARLLTFIDPLFSPAIGFFVTISYLAPSMLQHFVPWEEKDDQLAYKLADEIRTKYKRNPYINPVYYEHLDDLKNLPLYVQAAEFDFLMDDGIEIAKSWKGPTTMDVVANSYHAYLLFHQPRIQEHVDRLLNFMQNSFTR